MLRSTLPTTPELLTLERQLMAGASARATCAEILSCSSNTSVWRWSKLPLQAALPVGAYTEFYWTVNARALMNFVSLRAAETAQREIRRYAEAVEALTQAVSIDSTFALGYYSLSDAADRAGRAELAQRSAEQAIRAAQRVTPRRSQPMTLRMPRILGLGTGSIHAAQNRAAACGRVLAAGQL